MAEIKIIGENNAGDLRLKNDPFVLWGRMHPTRMDGKWDYTVEHFTEHREMCFPDEDYTLDETGRTVYLGAYAEGKCVGLAVLKDYFFRYMYVEDLKVSAAYRGRGIGRELIEAAARVAGERGYRGMYLVGQDDNLTACLFYLRTGFRIGGMDTEVYRGTKQEGKADILFYRENGVNV